MHIYYTFIYYKPPLRSRSPPGEIEVARPSLKTFVEINFGKSYREIEPLFHCKSFENHCCSLFFVWVRKPLFETTRFLFGFHDQKWFGLGFCRERERAIERKIGFEFHDEKREKRERNNKKKCM